MPQAAAAQAPDKFENRAGKRSGRDPGKPGRAERGPMQRLRGLGSQSSCKGNQLQVQEGQNFAKALLKLKASLFLFCNTFPLRP